MQSYIQFYRNKIILTHSLLIVRLFNSPGGTYQCAQWTAVSFTN